MASNFYIVTKYYCVQNVRLSKPHCLFILHQHANFNMDSLSTNFETKPGFDLRSLVFVGCHRFKMIWETFWWSAI
jgi:hypothetical protein